MVAFVPGLDLAAAFYREEVAPILRRSFSDLVYSAALLGSGSEVLGFDTERSTDHEWGPRLQLFLRKRDHAAWAGAVGETLRQELPTRFRGYPTHFGPADGAGIRGMQRAATGPVEHKIEITTLDAWLEEHLGFSAWREMDAIDWLLCSQQRLLEITAGAVFHDGLGGLEPVRSALAWYPPDVWRYLLAAQWTRIGQLEPFVGRCGEVGDEIGSALVAATLVRDVMALGFLLERRYAPYPKWFGSAFARLACAARLRPHLEGALAARNWTGREANLGNAYGILAVMHNALELTAPLPERVSPFYERPFQVIHGETFAAALSATIADETVRRLPLGVGGIDQWVDSTDVLAYPERGRQLRGLYLPSG